MIYRIFLLLAGIGVTGLYVWAPGAKGFPQEESAKILFFHVPPAMLCPLFYLWGAVMSIRYLRTKDPRFDVRAVAAIEVGTLLCVLATLTGMVFARVQWGAFWEWDPRQTSIFIQLLIYAAYFALRYSFSNQERSRAYSAAYAIFAFPTVPFLIFALPRMVTFTLHGGANQAVVGGGLDPTYRSIFYTTLVVILLCFAWAYSLRVREGEEWLAKEESDGLATGGSDTADPGVVRPVRLRDDG
ncbi:MAG: cytochrome c biogenesis protein CcsA [Fimbriimonadales bacterium]|nr:cytochrome c biogenesis protein CcsA [Fimbriimonadales bacterium]